MTNIKDLVKSKKNYIFDFDGTLVDLEELNISSFRKAFKQVLDVTMTTEEYKQLISGSGAKGGVMQYLKAKSLPLDAYEEIVKLFRDTKNAIIDSDLKSVITVKPGVAEFLQSLSERGAQIAIGSSSVHRYIEATMRAYGWERYFSVIVTADEVEHVKPEPDIFLLAMQKLGGTPSDSLIFEDSGNGVEAAKRSGMEYIVLHTPGYNDAVVKNQQHVILDYRECF